MDQKILQKRNKKVYGTQDWMYTGYNHLDLSIFTLRSVPLRSQGSSFSPLHSHTFDKKLVEERITKEYRVTVPFSTPLRF